MNAKASRRIEPQSRKRACFQCTRFSSHVETCRPTIRLRFPLKMTWAMAGGYSFIGFPPAFWPSCATIELPPAVFGRGCTHSPYRPTPSPAVSGSRPPTAAETAFVLALVQRLRHAAAPSSVPLPLLSPLAGGRAAVPSEGSSGPAGSLSEVIARIGADDSLSIIFDVL